MTTAEAVDLAEEVAAAHCAGALRAAGDITVSFSSGGLAFAAKRQPAALSCAEARLDPRQQRVTVMGGSPRPWTVSFAGSSEHRAHLEALRSGSRRLRWQPEDLGAFAAAALWTYITMPVLLERATRVDRLADAAGLRRLRVRLPRSIAGHGPVQTLHVGADGLVRRHDYTATAFGAWARAAQTVDAYRVFDGVPIGTFRRVTPRFIRPLPAPTLVWIDIHSIQLRG